MEDANIQDFNTDDPLSISLVKLSELCLGKPLRDYLMSIGSKGLEHGALPGDKTKRNHAPNNKCCGRFNPVGKRKESTLVFKVFLFLTMISTKKISPGVTNNRVNNSDENMQ